MEAKGPLLAESSESLYIKKLKKLVGFKSSDELKMSEWISDMIVFISTGLGKERNHLLVKQIQKVFSALQLAYICHYGQLRKSEGNPPYLIHLRGAVFNYLNVIGEDRPGYLTLDGIIKAIIHDCLEDFLDNLAEDSFIGSSNDIELFDELGMHIKQEFGKKVHDSVLYFFTKASKRPYLRTLFEGFDDHGIRKINFYGMVLGMAKKTKDLIDSDVKLSEMLDNISTLDQMDNRDTKVFDMANFIVFCASLGERVNATIVLGVLANVVPNDEIQSLMDYYNFVNLDPNKLTKKDLELSTPILGVSGMRQLGAAIRLKAMKATARRRRYKKRQTVVRKNVSSVVIKSSTEQKRGIIMPSGTRAISNINRFLNVLYDQPGNKVNSQERKRLEGIILGRGLTNMEDLPDIHRIMEKVVVNVGKIMHK